MSLGFPLHPCLHTFEVRVLVPKDTPTRYAHIVVVPWGLVFQSPVDLRPRDYITIDIRTGGVVVVERSGAMIWHYGWVN